MNEKTILDLANKIEPQIFILLLKLLAVGVTVLTFKGFVENVVAYIQFRLDKRLGQSVHVKVRGIEGKITNYNLSWIIVKPKDGKTIEIIAIKRWRMEKWTLVNGD